MKYSPEDISGRTTFSMQLNNAILSKACQKVVKRMLLPSGRSNLFTITE